MDNQTAIAITNNPIFHGKTKLFNIKIYFLKEVQKEGEILLQYCRKKDQFGKHLYKGKFENTREKLSVNSY